MKNMFKLSLLMGFLCAFNNAVTSSDDALVKKIDPETEIVSDGGAAFKERMNKHGQKIDGLYRKLSDYPLIECLSLRKYEEEFPQRQKLIKSINKHFDTIRDSGEIPNRCNDFWVAVSRNPWNLNSWSLDSWNLAVGKCVQQVKRDDRKLEERVQRAVERALDKQAAAAVAAAIKRPAIG